MGRPFSAYTALELEPGADRAAIEAAYRRLIKLHHPDRSGGDPGRAAEINRAYFELRNRPDIHSQPAIPPSPRPRSRRKRRRASHWPLIVLAAAGLGLTQVEPLARQAPRWAERLLEVPVPVASARRAAPAAVPFDGPIDEQGVAAAIADAVRLVERKDDQALVEHSRDCHRQLRAAPRLAELDRCAAFDSAVAGLLDRDPDHDSGPFSASSVTARQMTAASLLSNDYLAIERRLNRIRNRVELASSIPAPPPAGDIQP